MSIIVLSRPKIRETSFNQLLLVVCIVDTVFIFCNIPSCLSALGIVKLKSLRSWMDAFGQVSMCASVLMIVALTFERHFAIRAPHTVSIFFYFPSQITFTSVGSNPVCRFRVQDFWRVQVGS